MKKAQNVEISKFCLEIKKESHSAEKHTNWGPAGLKISTFQLNFQNISVISFKWNRKKCSKKLHIVKKQ